MSLTDPAADSVRRKYWTDYMDRMDALIDELLAYPYKECGEPLSSIADAFDAAGVEALFSDSLVCNEFERIFFIRESLLSDLVAIASDMNARGWVLKLEDGFRTEEMQTRLGRSPEAFDRIIQSCAWECGLPRPPADLVFKRARVLVANYGRGGTHMLGAAVDVSAFSREDGSEIWRGAPYIEMSELTPMDCPFVSEAERANRREITEVMERHRFTHFPGEFWHYNQGDALDQILRKTGAPGRFGPVHWDAASNKVIRYEDPSRPLNSFEDIEVEIDKALSRLSENISGTRH
jgi:D-alanyl-D-alanine dipeptidase